VPGWSGDPSRSAQRALDAIFLPMETDVQSLYVGSVLVIEGPAPDPAMFREHVVARLAGVPILRRRVLRMPLDLGWPIWVDATDFRPADQVRHAVLDANRPLWQMWQVDGLAGGRWAVVVKAHHTMVDGRSGADLVQSLLTGRPDALSPPAAVEHAPPAPTLVGLVGDLVAWLVCLPLRVIGLVVRSLRAPHEVRRRADQIRSGLAQLVRPDLPPSILNGPLGSRRIWGGPEQT
jgi:diacylglycerol O-acyltransferase